LFPRAPNHWVLLENALIFAVEGQVYCYFVFRKVRLA
jgi:hypothetical protein